MLDAAFLVASYHYGLGRHIEYLSPYQFVQMAKWLWVGELTNLFAVYLVRVSVSLFLLRLVPHNKKIYTRALWISITTWTITNIYASIIYLIQCRPIQKVWKPMIPGTCLNPTISAIAPWAYQGETYIQGTEYSQTDSLPGFSIFGDVISTAVPIFLFKDLHVRRKTKVGLIALLCLWAL